VGCGRSLVFLLAALDDLHELKVVQLAALDRSLLPCLFYLHTKYGIVLFECGRIRNVGWVQPDISFMDLHTSRLPLVNPNLFLSYANPNLTPSF